MGNRERQVVEEAMRRVEDHRQRRQESSSVRLLAGWWVLVLLAFFLAPWPLGDKAWVSVHGLCAQHAGHMIAFGQKLLPLCTRDSGLYVGALLGTLYLLARGRWLAAGRPPRWFWYVMIAVVLFFGVDVVNSTGADWFGASAYTPSNTLRLVSGLAMGLVTSVPVLWAINLSFKTRKLDRPILSGWIDMAGLVAVAVTGGLALASGWPPLYTPLLLLSLLGLVAMLLAANALGLLSLTRGAKAVLTGYWEASGPLLWGSVATVVEMAVLAWLRYRFF